jgi:outer membrane murein-binding lipoprotein Lpp
MKTNLLKVGAIALVTILLAGCVVQSTIAALTSTLGSAAAAIAAVEGNTALATQLQTDTNAAVSAVTNWKTGSATADVIEALNLVEDDLNLIPIAGPYTPLIDICIGAVQAILAELPSSAALPAAKVAHAHRVPVLSQPAPKNSKQFVKQWNEYLTLNPSVNLPKL